jgi:hypothetical protein
VFSSHAGKREEELSKTEPGQNIRPQYSGRRPDRKQADGKYLVAFARRWFLFLNISQEKGGCLPFVRAAAF